MAPSAFDPAPVTARARAADGRDGWSLGDLLARASHDEEAQAEARAVAEEAAQIASEAAARARAEPFRLDVGIIARAVDPGTASAIWNRLRAGQRNVMVRSIYAPDARTAFDQISARVKTDADLAQTVTRYLSDFERIIKDADQRDPTGRMAHSHLISDTGRVYLFLAHASGRIS